MHVFQLFIYLSGLLAVYIQPHTHCLFGPFGQYCLLPFLGHAWFIPSCPFFSVHLQLLLQAQFCILHMLSTWLCLHFCLPLYDIIITLDLSWHFCCKAIIFLLFYDSDIFDLSNFVEQLVYKRCVWKICLSVTPYVGWSQHMDWLFMKVWHFSKFFIWFTHFMDGIY